MGAVAACRLHDHHVTLRLRPCSQAWTVWSCCACWQTCSWALIARRWRAECRPGWPALQPQERWACWHKQGRSGCQCFSFILCCQRGGARKQKNNIQCIGAAAPGIPLTAGLLPCPAISLVCQVVSEAVLRQAVEAEWAEEGLEMETDHASAALREIVAEAPPSPRFAPYYEAYLRRWVAQVTATQRLAPGPCPLLLSYTTNLLANKTALL